MVQNGPKLSRTVHTLSRMVQNSPKYSNGVNYGLIWCKYCLQNHPNASGKNRSPCLVFTESAPRPIQSKSCNVNQLEDKLEGFEDVWI